MDLQRYTPEAAGIATQHVLDFLRLAEENGIELHGFQFLRRGKIFAEGWFSPYTKDDRHILFSFTKSFTSTAIGFAWQEGLIKLDDRLVDIFPEKVPESPSENLRLCTVRDLLTMGCGQETEIDWYPGGAPDFVEAFLRHPFVYKPGTKFMYNTAGTNMLAEILLKKTGENLVEYLTPRLLDPIGIKNMYCVQMPDGAEIGGAGGFVTTEDMARFTQFVANRGVWEGNQLLQSAWFDMATTKQIDNAPNWGRNWEMGYGFQFWMCAPAGVYRGDGAFGQFGVVCPQEEAVFVVNSASANMAVVLDLLFGSLKQNFQEEPLPEDKHAQIVLAHVCKHLSLHTPLSRRHPGAAAKYNGKRYAALGNVPVLSELIGGEGIFHRAVLWENPPKPYAEEIKKLEVCFGDNHAKLTFTTDRGTEELPVSMTSSYNRFSLDKREYGAVGGWTRPDEFCFDARCVNAATGACISLRFTEKGLTLRVQSCYPDHDAAKPVEKEEYSFLLLEKA